MRPLVALLFVVSLLNSYEAQEPSAVTTVFVKKGDDLILNVDADVPEKFFNVDWNFNKTAFLVRFAPDAPNRLHPNFTGRIEFPVKKFSVKLKNLQEADSGVYAATVFTEQGNRPLAEYKVTVQGPVSPVELTVDPVDSVVSRSSDSCNLTVTCSTQHSHISSTFRCVNRTCSQEGGEQSELTTSGASLQLYLLNSSIICNHSNHVNWTKDFKIIEKPCPQYAAPDPEPDPVIVIVIITIIIPVIVGLLVLFLYHRKRKRGNHGIETIENTVYEVPQITTAAQPLDQSPTDDASGLSPTSTYSLVGPHTGSLIPTETGGTQPESLYAQVEKPARSSNN